MFHLLDPVRDYRWRGRRVAPERLESAIAASSCPRGELGAASVVLIYMYLNVGGYSRQGMSRDPDRSSFDLPL